MGKRAKAKVVGTTVSLAFIGSMVASTPAMAAVINDITPVVTVNDADGVVGYYSPFSISVTMDVPDTVSGGDTFTMGITSQFKIAVEPVELRAPDGSLVATVVSNNDGTVTYTFTDYVNTHTNVKTGVDFWIEIDRANVQQGTTVPVVLTVNGQAKNAGGADVSTAPPGATPSAYKYGAWRDQAQGTMMWGVVVTAKDVDRGTVTIVDTPQPGAKLKCPADGGRLELYVGTDRDNTFWTGSSAMINPSNYTVTCTGDQLTLIINPYQDTNGDGTVDNTDTVIPAGAELELRGRMVVADPNMTSYTNVADISVTTGTHVDNYLGQDVTIQKMGASGWAIGVDGAVNVGDYVWKDTNKNGIQDAGEPGIPGVVLNVVGPNGQPVTDINGNVVSSVTTDENGAYAFNALPILQPGESYTVNVDRTASAAALAGLEPTAEVTTDNARNSSTWSAASGDLTVSRASDLTLDFGFVDVPVVVPPAEVSVGNFVWYDANDNGVQDAGEAGIPGVVLTLVGPNGQPVQHVDGTDVAPATTDANGEYQFTNLPALQAGDAYTVNVDYAASGDALAGYVPTQVNVGTPDLDSSRDSAVSSDLVNNGDTDQTLDFGFVRAKVSAGDRVWMDTNGNGIQDAGEPGIPGVVLKITGPNGEVVRDVDGNVVADGTTDADGNYLFPRLPVLAPGESYTVTIDEAASADALRGLVPTLTGQGTTDTDSSTGSVSSGDLTTNGAQDLTLDFGFRPATVSVGDTVWIDTNRDGMQDAGDKMLPGVTITLLGPDGNAVKDVNGADVAPVVTDANGKYVFENLPALFGSDVYTTQVDYTASADALKGLTPTTANVGDRTADSDTDKAVSTTLSADGSSDMTLDFGFQYASVSVGDFVWLDADKDGQQDADEQGISGVQMGILDPEGNPAVDIFGNPVPTVTTDSGGHYGFDMLPVLNPGEAYAVYIVSNDGPLADLQPTTPGVGSDRTVDSSDWVAESTGLNAPGEVDSTLDFGFVAADTPPVDNPPVDTPDSVTVGDLVWFDVNGDGIQSDGEFGIPNVVVTITDDQGNPVTDINGKVVGPTTTNVDGEYKFVNLPVNTGDSHYITHVVDTDQEQWFLDSFIPTRANVGDNRAVDSSDWEAAALPLTTDKAEDMTLDFGFFSGYPVGDTVWFDTNHDGIQDADEPGIEGVEVILTDLNGNEVNDIFGNPVKPVKTDADGNYVFPGLPEGQYRVSVNPDTVPEGYAPTIDEVGNDRDVDSSTGYSDTVNLGVDNPSDFSNDFGFYTDGATPPPVDNPVDTPVDNPVDNPVDTPVDNPVNTTDGNNTPTDNRTCEEIGRVNIPAGDADYSAARDSDRDGIACEEPVKVTNTVNTVPNTVPDQTVVQEQPTTQRLAKTGFAAGAISLAAMGLTAAGAGLLRGRRKFQNN